MKCLKGQHDSAPPGVLKRTKRHLKKEELRNSDEAWLVVDRDQWTDKQLAELHQWSQEAPKYGFALSNPKFEFWLRLHFEDGDNVGSSKECSRRLKQHLPYYDKGIDVRKISEKMLDCAIERAKRRDTPPCNDRPRTTGTTVYKLVESILKSRESVNKHRFSPTISL